MNYLLDRRKKRNKRIKFILFVALIFIFIYFSASLFQSFSSTSNTVFRPFLVFGNKTGGSISDFFSSFKSKSVLSKENQNLQTQLNEAQLQMLNYDSLLEENIKLKEVLGRKDKNDLLLANILSKPNQSLYDTVLIDVGLADSVSVGDTVFALGNIPLGKVSQVFERSAKVNLFSSWKEKTEVVLPNSDVFMQMVGRGGGNFEMILPRDFELEKGEQVVLPGAHPYLVAVVETIISDPRDSYKKAILVSPVNIQGLKFLQIKRNVF